MSGRNPYLVAPYSALASIYDQVGFSNYAIDHIPSYIAYAQSLDWAGRRLIDMGCGTGITSWWLASQGYRTLAVDISPHMLAQIEKQSDKVGDIFYEPPEQVQGDVRSFASPMGAVDMVLAVGGLINAMSSLRELEAVFNRINQMVEPDRLFVFDTWTIRGLASNPGDEVCYQDDDLIVMARRSFSFETLSRSTLYQVWRRVGEGWSRQDELHIERGYPVQGIVTMLERTGFHAAALLDSTMQPYDPQEDRENRVVIMAAKALKNN